MHKDLERNLGAQPIAQLMTELDIQTQDLVAISPEQITHKMVARARKGRRLTPNVQFKILRAFNLFTGKDHSLPQLFTY